MGIVLSSLSQCHLYHHLGPYFQRNLKSVQGYHPGFHAPHQKELQDTEEVLQGPFVYVEEINFLLINPQRLQTLRLEYREKKLLAKQSKTGDKYTVFRNVSTQADLHDSEGDAEGTEVKVAKHVISRRYKDTARNQRFWNECQKRKYWKR